MDIASLRKGELGQFQRRLRVLQDRKRAQLLEQAALAKKLDSVYLGYVEDSSRICKDLDRAIVISKQPGHINYLVAQKQDLDATKVMIAAIGQSQADIEATTAEIKAMEDRNKASFR